MRKSLAADIYTVWLLSIQTSYFWHTYKELLDLSNLVSFRTSDPKNVIRKIILLNYIVFNDPVTIISNNSSFLYFLNCPTIFYMMFLMECGRKLLHYRNTITGSNRSACSRKKKHGELYTQSTRQHVVLYVGAFSNPKQPFEPLIFTVMLLEDAWDGDFEEVFWSLTINYVLVTFRLMYLQINEQEIVMHVYLKLNCRHPFIDTASKLLIESVCHWACSNYLFHLPCP